MPQSHDLDVVCIGRASVDLYGSQIGGRLEDMASFTKYVGGCPTNIAVGTARLGLKSALITRVGDEHMGRFIREQLMREGVETAGVRTDPARPTALVILGIRDRDTFPLIFYRENCADMAIDTGDIDEALIRRAAAVVVTGTHFSTPGTDAAMREAMRLARTHGGKVVFDIDYRPVLWGLTGLGAGENRFVADAAVTRHLQSIVPDCDLIVGTEEEFHILGGTTDTIAALRRVRALSDAVLVCKRGALGCAVFPQTIPDSLDDGITAPGFPVEVFNVLGAGDAFMSGLLRGWLRGEAWEVACRYANICGAVVVSRHGCAPAMPSWAEVQYLMSRTIATRRLQEEADLNHLHWSTTRRRDWPEVLAFACDHRVQIEQIAAHYDADHSRIGAFKELALAATRAVGGDDPKFGMLLDGRFGQTALDKASGTGMWLARPVELPGSRPLRFEGPPDIGLTLNTWPVDHIVKCLVYYDVGDDAALREAQERQVLTLHDACRVLGRELLLEIIAPADVAADNLSISRAVARFYDLGIRPDWWKLAALPDQEAWTAVDAVIRRNDPQCRGVLLLGLDAPLEAIAQAFALAARQPICKGFAVGRTIFGDAAHRWFAGTLDDEAAVAQMAGLYRRLVDHWQAARAAAME